MAFISSLSNSSVVRLNLGTTSFINNVGAKTTKTKPSYLPKRNRCVISAQRRTLNPNDEAFVTCPKCGSDEPISASSILKNGSLNTKCGQCGYVWTAMAEDALTITGESLAIDIAGDDSDDDALSRMIGVKLFVTGLGPKVDSTKLRTEVERFGEVTDAKVIYDKVTGRSRGFGFVTVVGRSAASAAIDSLTGDTSAGLGVRLKVKEAND